MAVPNTKFQAPKEFLYPILPFARHVDGFALRLWRLPVK